MNAPENCFFAKHGGTGTLFTQKAPSKKKNNKGNIDVAWMIDVIEPPLGFQVRRKWNLKHEEGVAFNLKLECCELSLIRKQLSTSRPNFDAGWRVLKA